MAGPIDAVFQELQRLRSEGVDSVFLSDEAITLIHAESEASRGVPSAAPSGKPETNRGITPQNSDPSANLREALDNDSSTPEPASAARKAPTGTPRPKPKTGTSPIPADPPTVELPDIGPEEQMAWLRERVETCPVCNEHLSAKGKVVFGTGAVDADIFFCGEAPGADEELQGEPFAGKAGQLLTKIIEAMGLRRDAVYIANILKWRPEHDKPYGNRPPTPEEMDYCLPYLRAQLEIVRPKVIVALGNTAVTGLFGPDPKRRMGKIRGKWDDFNGIPTMITFHPSYLLRNDTIKTKRMAWEDMLQVMEKVGMDISDKQRGFFLPK